MHGCARAAAFRETAHPGEMLKKTREREVTPRRPGCRAPDPGRGRLPHKFPRPDWGEARKPRPSRARGRLR